MDAAQGRRLVKFKTITVARNPRLRLSGGPVTTGQQLVHLKRVISLIFQDQNVEYVIRHHGSPTSWHNLINIFEAIESDVGGLIITLGWATKSELDTFTRTANSRQAIGDEARHGHNKFDPPKKPMTLQQACELIARITCKWIDYKLSAQP
jgi:hypothetical protein